jgi:hypothetical protein
MQIESPFVEEVRLKLEEWEKKQGQIFEISPRWERS